MKAIDQMTSQLPPGPDWQREVRLDHIYKEVVLGYCEAVGVPTLGEVLAAGRGRTFCSTEVVLPSPDIYEAARTTNTIKPAGKSQSGVRIECSTRFVRADTLRMQLSQGARLAIVAILDRPDGDTLVFHPLVMGAPWVRSEDPQWAEAIWWGQDFFENFIEDFEEFAKVRDEPVPESYAPMKVVSERAFKTCLANILGDSVSTDWGGERSDHYSAHLHLGSRRVTGAFLLKGPAKFAPMGLNHLGKNNDQIYRLAQEPADVLFVQHCHEITTPVRATLRAFAVHPGQSRRYCLIDGRDSLRLLRAYGLYKEAVQMSA